MANEIFITQVDKEKLLDMIDKAYENSKSHGNLKKLETEINRAKIINPETQINNVITMNSTVALQIDEDIEEITLVYPEDADIKKNKLSVFSPIGTAILGYREGDLIQWDVPDGAVHIKVMKIK